MLSSLVHFTIFNTWIFFTIVVDTSGEFLLAGWRIWWSGCVWCFRLSQALRTRLNKCMWRVDSYGPFTTAIRRSRWSCWINGLIRIHQNRRVTRIHWGSSSVDGWRSGSKDLSLPRMNSGSWSRTAGLYLRRCQQEMGPKQWGWGAGLSGHCH